MSQFRSSPCRAKSAARWSRRWIGKWILRWKASICNRNGYCDNTFFFRKTDPKPCRLCEADLRGTSRALHILVLQAALPRRIEQGASVPYRPALLAGRTQVAFESQWIQEIDAMTLQFVSRPKSM